METPLESAINLQPSVIKACSRCRTRKVKCGLQLPQCSACKRHGGTCDITDGVSYPYGTVESLLGRIQTLEVQLAEAAEAADSSQRFEGRATPVSIPSHLQEDHDLSKEAEEIGILTIGGPSASSGGAYIGSASGSTFARIFFKQLSLSPPDLVSSAGPNKMMFDRDPTTRQASLPPHCIAKQLFEEYVARVHIWWPFLALPFLRTVFEQIYREPQQCGDYEKFLVFAVLALASRSATVAGTRTMDLNTAESYYQTCLGFHLAFRDLTPSRRLPLIHSTLLLGLWLLETPKGLRDLWHLSRHAMSSAIEAGLHRYNADWRFGENEVEIRNRTWWCVYNLERQVATMTGRVLSIRDHAVQTPLPVFKPSLDLVALDRSTNTTGTYEGTRSMEPFRRLIELRRLSGRILESVYVRRHQNRSEFSTTSDGGNSIGVGDLNDNVDTSLQQICARAEAIGLELTAWDQRLESMPMYSQSPYEGSGESIHSRYRSELRIESSLLQLLLYRPSPAFMIPSTQMVLASGRAARTAIKEWATLEELQTTEGGRGICVSVRQLHGIVMAGLATLYCDWRAIQASSDPAMLPPGYMWLESDTQTCLGLIERGVSSLGSDTFGFYSGLFRASRARVYMSRPVKGQRGSGLSTGPAMADIGTAERETYATPLFGEELDTYLSGMGDFLNDGAFERDEALTGWYAELMQSTVNTPMRPEDAWY